MTNQEIAKKVYGKVKFLSNTVFQTTKGIKFEIIKAFSIDSNRFYLSTKQLM